MGDIINLWELLFHIVNLVILYLIGRRFLYKPVKKFLDARTKKFADEREAIDAGRKEIADYEVQKTQILAEARSRAMAIEQESTETARIQAELILAQAREKAEQMVASMRAEAENELRIQQVAVRKEVTDLSVQIAQSILEREFSEQDQERLIEQFITRVVK